MYQDLYDRAKKIIKNDVYLKNKDTSRPLYLEVMNQVFAFEKKSNSRPF